MTSYVNKCEKILISFFCYYFSGSTQLPSPVRLAEGARRDVHLGVGAAVRLGPAPLQEREVDAAVHGDHPVCLLEEHRGWLFC